MLKTGNLREPNISWHFIRRMFFALLLLSFCCLKHFVYATGTFLRRMRAAFPVECSVSIFFSDGFLLLILPLDALPLPHLLPTADGYWRLFLQILSGIFESAGLCLMLLPLVGSHLLPKTTAHVASDVALRQIDGALTCFLLQCKSATELVTSSPVLSDNR